MPIVLYLGMMRNSMRRVRKDKRTGVPVKYLSGTGGTTRRQLASIPAGKPIPQSLINRRIQLGKKT